jgi:hypothetical protein
MNIYSSTPFIEAFGKAYFPGESLQAGDFLLQGKTWRLPTLPNGEPITGGEFISFFEPLPSSQLQITRRSVPYIPAVSYGIVTAQEWFDENLFLSYDEPSPLIDWTGFASWDAFTDYVKSKHPKLSSDSKRRRRKLEKEIGPVTFMWQDNREETIAFCIQCKSAQFQISQELFAEPSNVYFLKELAQNGLLIVSSLSAGDTLLAVHLGAFWEDRFYSWITTYDSQYAAYAPGRLMTESILESNYQRGHQEFDFLKCGESYKWNYATHTRLINDMGGLLNSAKMLARRQMRPFPETMKKFRKIKLDLLIKFDLLNRR